MAATTMVDFDADSPVDLTNNVFKYFYSNNYINRSILSHERVFKKHLNEQWENMPPERRDALLDLLFVDEEVRKNYADVSDNDNHSAIYGSHRQSKQSKNSDTDAKTTDESFPRLLINSGQKINVDFENELWTWKDEHSGPFSWMSRLWTWKDEHSGPFSWMSRSQQDLTLDDLEPENILKPQPKQLRVDLEDESSVKKAEDQFTYPCNSWCHDILEDFKKHQAEVNLTPSPSLDLNIMKVSSSMEEVNPAFEGSVDDLSPRPSPEREDRKESSSEKEENPDNIKSKKKEQGRKSPSPKKIIIRSGSFKKSPVKKSERGKEEKLIMKGEESFVAEAYCNPVMESEWSNFVGEQHTVPITDAPGVQVIDRGVERPEDTSAASPYRGDQVQLIQDPEESPAQPRSALPSNLAMTPDYSDWSAESTPDHKTHLLKGLQSPVHNFQKNNASGAYIDHEQSTLFTTSQEKGHNDGTPLGQTEELLTVVMDGNDIHVTSEEKRESNIPSTGFDFLDNW